MSSKSERQKRYNAMVLQINEIFPDVDLQTIIDAVKKSNLDFDIAVGYVIEENEKKNPTVKPASVPTKQTSTSKPSKETPKEQKKEPKVNEELVEKVLSVVCNASRYKTIKVLAECNQDEDMAILTLLNDPNPGEEAPVAPKPESTGKEEEETGEEDEEIAVDDEFEYIDEELATEDDYEEWFSDPLSEVEKERELKRLSEKQKKQQISSDEAIARSLMLIEEQLIHEKGKKNTSKWASQENDISKIALGPNDAPRINPKKNSSSHTTSKVERVEYSPMLKNFLTYLEDKEILELTGTVPNTNPVVSTPGSMKLHNVLSDLKKQTEQFHELKKSELPWEVAKRERLNKEKGNSNENSNSNSNSNRKDFFSENAPISPREMRPFTSIAECIQEQESEIEALRAFLVDDLIESDSFPRRFCIRIISEKHKNIPFLLIITFPPKYPFVAPKIAVRWNSFTGLTNEQYNKFQNYVKRLIQENLGELMILNLLDKFKQALESFEIPSPDASLSDHQDSVKLLLSSNYKCLSPDDIVKEQSSQVSKISQQLSLPTYVVRPLLRSFGYSSDDLVKEYKKAKTENRVSSLFEKIGLPFKESVEIKLSISDYENTYECSTCFDDFPIEEMTGLKYCKHFFCNDCYSKYIQVQILEVGGSADGIQCPAQKCKYLVDPITIASLTDLDLYKKYYGFVINAFVDKNPSIKWCPARLTFVKKDTDTDTEDVEMPWNPNKRAAWFVVTVEESGASIVSKGHWPAWCLHVKWYNEKYKRKDDPDADMKTVRWIEQYTRDCPKCKAAIEKNGGCNHMSCKSCTYEFCWVCLGNWSGSHYNCSSSTNQNGRDLASRYETALANLSFDQLFLLHESSRLHDDIRIKKVAEEKLKNYVRSVAKATIQDCQVIVQAVEHIYLCRHIALNACIMGQYIVHHKLPGSKALRPEIAKLQANINLLSASIDVPIKQLSISSISDFTKGVRLGIKSLQMKLSSINTELKKFQAQQK